MNTHLRDHIMLLTPSATPCSLTLLQQEGGAWTQSSCLDITQHQPNAADTVVRFTCTHTHTVCTNTQLHAHVHVFPLICSSPVKVQPRPTSHVFNLDHFLYFHCFYGPLSFACFCSISVFPLHSHFYHVCSISCAAVSVCHIQFTWL